MDLRDGTHDHHSRRTKPGRAGGLWLALLGVASTTSGCGGLALAPDPVQVFRGPLPSRIQHPLSLTQLGLRPRSAHVHDSGQPAVLLEAAYTSLYEVADTPGQRVEFDGELGRSSARFRFGAAEGLDVEVELAAHYTTSGFLDHTVNLFHDLFLLPGQGRDRVEDDQFSMLLELDGERVFEVQEDAFGLADLPIVLTRQLGEATRDEWAFAARAGIELPTGAESKGFGSGGFEYGAGLLTERSFGRLTYTGGLDVILTNRPSSFVGTGVRLEDLVQVHQGLEVRWNDDLSWLFQLVWNSPLTRDFTFEEIDREILDLGVGAIWDCGEGRRFFVSFHEDVVAATGPDFSARVGLHWAP